MKRNLFSTLILVLLAMIYVRAQGPGTVVVTTTGLSTGGHTISWAANGQAMDSGAMPPLGCTTGSIGGGLLVIGGTTSGTATCTGALAGQPCSASASDGTNMMALGLEVHCDVTSVNTATVTLYAIISLTPAAKTYTVRVHQ